MKNKLFAAVIGLTYLGTALAGGLATPEQAKSLSQKAQSAVNSMGKDKAVAAFSDPKGGFQELDLYVFCMNLDGVMVSHAKKPGLVGKNLLEFNKYGDFLFKDMVAVAQEPGQGWVSYKWPYPGTEEVREKKSYIAMNNAGFFCGVGAYK